MAPVSQKRYTVRRKCGDIVGVSNSFEDAKALACAGINRVLYERVELRTGTRIIKRGTYSEGKWVPTT
jgi:hypothetical protein